MQPHQVQRHLDGAALDLQAVAAPVVASRRRAGVIVARLRQRGVADDRIGVLKAPAGLDIGAVTPEEIAVSILAEIIQHRRTAKPSVAAEAPAATTAIDPICGMTVVLGPDALSAPDADGEARYFCGEGCLRAFEQLRASA